MMQRIISQSTSSEIVEQRILSALRFRFVWSCYAPQLPSFFSVCLGAKTQFPYQKAESKRRPSVSTRRRALITCVAVNQTRKFGDDREPFRGASKIRSAHVQRQNASSFLLAIGQPNKRTLFCITNAISAISNSSTKHLAKRLYLWELCPTYFAENQRQNQRLPSLRSHFCIDCVSTKHSSLRDVPSIWSGLPLVTSKKAEMSTCDPNCDRELCG